MSQESAPGSSPSPAGPGALGAWWINEPTTVLSDTIVVGTGAVQVLDQDPNRIGWTLINRSGNDGAIDWSDVVVQANGLLVSANGGNANMDWLTDGSAVTEPVWGIGAAAGETWRRIRILARQPRSGP